MLALLHKIRLEKSNILSTLSTSALSFASSFVVVLAFANLVDTHTLGTYQYIISIVSIIGSVSLTGLLNSIIRAISKEDYSFLSTAKRYLYIGSLPAVIIGTLIAIYYVLNGNLFLALGIGISNILYLLSQVQYRFNAIYVAIGEIQKMNVLLKLHAISPVFIVLPVLFTIKEPHILAILYFAAGLTAFLVGIRLFDMRQKEKELIFKDTNSNQQHNNKYLKFGFHQSVITCMSTIGVHLDKILIFQFLGASQTAMYFISISIPDRFRSIVKQFDSLIFARFAKHDLKAVQNKIIIRFLTALVLIIPFYSIYILTAPILFKLFLPQYIDAIHISQLYAITLFAGALVIPQSALKAHASSGELYFNSFFIILTKPLFIFIGIYLGGLQGAIIGASLGLLIYTAVNLISSLRVKGIND